MGGRNLTVSFFVLHIFFFAAHEKLSGALYSVLQSMSVAWLMIDD